MSLTGVLLRHANWIRDREVGGELQVQGRRTSWAGPGPGHRSRSPKAGYERGAHGIAVRVVEAMWRSVAIRARLSKRKGKEEFSSSWVVVCRSFWPSFMKSYTADGRHNAVNLGLCSRATPWARCVQDDLEFAKPGKYSSQAGQAKVSDREGREDWSLLLELNLWNVITMRPGRDIRLGNVLGSRTHAFAVSWAHDGADLPMQYAPAWAMPSTSSPRMSFRGRQLPLRDRRELKGASWVHGIFMQVFTVWDSTCTFFAKTCPGKWRFEVSRSERRG